MSVCSPNHTYRFPQRRSKPQGESHDQINYQPMFTETTTATSLAHAHPHTTPPPSALMHPTLLEKMRLGTPTSGHIHLCTVNRSQSQTVARDEFYRLQDASPFPRLPPYYVHSSTAAVKRTSERDHVQSSPPQMNGKIPSRSKLPIKDRSENGEQMEGYPVPRPHFIYPALVHY